MLPLTQLFTKKVENRYFSGDYDVEDINTGRTESGDWRNYQNQLIYLKSNQNRNAVASAKMIRNNYCHYFNSIGSVPWQNKFA
jgi:hypothetical protein